MRHRSYPHATTPLRPHAPHLQPAFTASAFSLRAAAASAYFPPFKKKKKKKKSRYKGAAVCVV